MEFQQRSIFRWVAGKHWSGNRKWVRWKARERISLWQPRPSCRAAAQSNQLFQHSASKDIFHGPCQQRPGKGWPPLSANNLPLQIPSNKKGLIHYNAAPKALRNYQDDVFIRKQLTEHTFFVPLTKAIVLKKSGLVWKFRLGRFPEEPENRKSLKIVHIGFGSPLPGP